MTEFLMPVVAGIWIPVVAALIVLILLCIIRLVIGPTAADRVIAVDTVNTLTIASMVILGLLYKEVIFIDVALVYALLSFVSTLYIAKYLGGEL
jgi:multicomponent Na+:H+ antiporter subunit F